MKIIYIVQGSSGQYDDYREWNVRAYTTDAAAEAHRQRAQQAANEVTKRRQEIWDEYENDLSVFDRLNAATINPHDPEMSWDTPLSYTVVSLELSEE